MKRWLLVPVVFILIGCSQAVVEEASPTPGSLEGVGEGTQLRDAGTYAVAELTAVDGSDARGSASAFYAEDGSVYRMSATFENLEPIDEEKFFYEGWLVRGRGDFISTGRVEQIEQVMVNTFESEENYLDYGTYVLTLEPTDDGVNGEPDPAPAEHVVEGDFVEN